MSIGEVEELTPEEIEAAKGAQYFRETGFGVIRRDDTVDF